MNQMNQMVQNQINQMVQNQMVQSKIKKNDPGYLTGIILASFV